MARVRGVYSFGAGRTIPDYEAQEQTARDQLKARIMNNMMSQFNVMNQMSFKQRQQAWAEAVQEKQAERAAAAETLGLKQRGEDMRLKHEAVERLERFRREDKDVRQTALDLAADRHAEKLEREDKQRRLDTERAMRAERTRQLSENQRNLLLEKQVENQKAATANQTEQLRLKGLAEAARRTAAEEEDARQKAMRRKIDPAAAEKLGYDPEMLWDPADATQREIDAGNLHNQRAGEITKVIDYIREDMPHIVELLKQPEPNMTPAQLRSFNEAVEIYESDERFGGDVELLKRGLGIVAKLERRGIEKAGEPLNRYSSAFEDREWGGARGWLLPSERAARGEETRANLDRLLGIGGEEPAPESRFQMAPSAQPGRRSQGRPSPVPGSQPGSLWDTPEPVSEPGKALKSAVAAPLPPGVSLDRPESLKLHPKDRQNPVFLQDWIDRVEGGVEEDLQRGIEPSDDALWELKELYKYLRQAKKP